jgi:hypothetical protein
MKAINSITQLLIKLNKSLLVLLNSLTYFQNMNVLTEKYIHSSCSPINYNLLIIVH